MQIHELKDGNGDVVHACATASFPLPADHWIYEEPVQPEAISELNSALSQLLRLKIKEALKYTLQVCTLQGKDSDFDPDAMWLTLDNVLFTRKAGVSSET